MSRAVEYKMGPVAPQAHNCTLCSLLDPALAGPFAVSRLDSYVSRFTKAE